MGVGVRLHAIAHAPIVGVGGSQTGRMRPVMQCAAQKSNKSTFADPPEHGQLVIASVGLVIAFTIQSTNQRHIIAGDVEQFMIV
jgi:hypothetical protein